MDFFILFISSILIIFLLPLISFKFLTSKTINTLARNPTNGKVPLGSMGWPIIGEGLELLKYSRLGTPEKFFFDRIAKYSSEIFTTSFLGEKVTCFCGASSNKFLFSNHSKYVEFSLLSTVKRVFPYTDPEKSEKVRKMIVSLESKKVVGIIDSMTRKHFEDFWDTKKENEVMTVYPLAKKHTFTIACKLFIGLDDPAKINEFLKDFITIINGFFGLQINFPGTRLNRAIKASQAMRNEIMSIINERKNNKLQHINEEDVLSYMILDNNDEDADANNDDVLTMADKMVGMLIAAHDSASVVMTNITKYIAELPEVYDAVRIEQINIAKEKGPGELLNLSDIQKMRYSWNVVCEVLRLAPPAQASFRKATTDFAYAGYFIPKGRTICWSAASTHKNHDYFPNPEKFDPSRYEGSGPAPYTYVPFGGGPHTCPGKEYAKLTILTFVHHLVTRYKWRNLFSGPNDVGKFIFNPFPLPRNGLPIVLQPHSPDTTS